MWLVACGPRVRTCTGRGDRRALCATRATLPTHPYPARPRDGHEGVPHVWTSISRRRSCLSRTDDSFCRTLGVVNVSSVRRALWEAAEIFPRSTSSLLILRDEQREMVSLFAPPSLIRGGARPLCADNGQGYGDEADSAATRRRVSAAASR